MGEMKKCTKVISLRRKRFAKKYKKILKEYKKVFFGTGIVLVIGILVITYKTIIR